MPGRSGTAPPAHGGRFTSPDAERRRPVCPTLQRARSTAAVRACGRGSRTASPGCGIFFFLFAHVLDTALVRVSPEAYNTVIATYKNPIVGLLEVGLVAAVLFHAFNGLRIMLVDFWSKGPRVPAAACCSASSASGWC